MIMNQGSFESALLKLSNALRIVLIEQFFDFLLDVKVEVFFWVYDSLQSSWNFKNWTSQYRTLECPLTALVSHTLCAWIKIYIVDDFNQSVLEAPFLASISQRMSRWTSMAFLTLVIESFSKEFLRSLKNAPSVRLHWFLLQWFPWVFKREVSTSPVYQCAVNSRYHISLRDASSKRRVRFDPTGCMQVDRPWNHQLHYWQLGLRLARDYMVHFSMTSKLLWEALYD